MQGVEEDLEVGKWGCHSCGLGDHQEISETFIPCHALQPPGRKTSRQPKPFGNLFLAEALLGQDRLLPAFITSGSWERFHVPSSGSIFLMRTLSPLLPSRDDSLKGWGAGLLVYVATESRNIYDTGDAIRGHSSDLTGSKRRGYGGVRGEAVGDRNWRWHKLRM